VRAFPFAIGVNGTLLQTYVALDLLGCSTRVLDFFGRGFGSVRRCVKLVGEFVQRLEGVAIRRLALRHCHRRQCRRAATIAQSKREHLEMGLA
jgi:hypothetical protein